MTTRRTFLKFTALSVGAFAVGPEFGALAANAPPLIDGVADACRRLAPLGWGQMLLDVTGGQLNVAATDLRGELSKPLAHIDRTYPGFGDFAASATRAIEPGSPDRSLLYHAFAAPTVVADRKGVELGGFPTLAEIDALENYVYGIEPPTLDALQARVNAMSPALQGGATRRKLGLVVYALAISEHADVGARAPCASPVRASPGLEQSIRCTTRERATLRRWTRHSHSNFASCRVVSQCISRRSSRGGAGSDLRIRCPATIS
jgi:hypothetical protein